MLKVNILLKNYSHYRIGGPANFFLEASDIDELTEGLREFCEKSPAGKIFILGAGTNVLFSDDGFLGLVILPHFKDIKKINNLVLEVGSGVLVKDLIEYCTENNLAGLEWAGGLPGTIGGAIFGNAGAFGGETKDNLLSVTSFNIETGETVTRENETCQFSYRTSIFKSELNMREIIVSAKFQFQQGHKKEIEEQVDEKIAYRKTHQPLELPNIGSTFKNVDTKKIPDNILLKYQDKIKFDPFPVVPAAVFLSEVGLKGERIGDIEISKVHPNFFVNLGSGSAKDVRALIKLAQEKVKAKFKIELETEIIEVD